MSDSNSDKKKQRTDRPALSLVNGMTTEFERPKHLSILIIAKDSLKSSCFAHELHTTRDYLFPNLELTIETAKSLDGQIARLNIITPDILILTDQQDPKQADLLKTALTASRTMLVLQQLPNSDGDRIQFLVLQRGAFRAVMRDYHCIESLPEALLVAAEKRLLFKAIAASDNYSDVINKSSISCMLVNESGKCTSTNMAYQDFSGQTSRRARDDGWTAIIHPADRARVIAAIAAVTHRRETFRAEFRVATDDGQVSWVCLERLPIVGKNGVEAFIQTFTDLTTAGSCDLDRHTIQRPGLENGAAVQAALNLVNEAVLSTDESGRVIFINTLAESMLGIAKQDALGQPAKRILHFLDGVSHATVASPIQRLLEDNHSSQSINGLLLVCADGQEISVECSSATVVDSYQRLTAVVMVFHDMRHSDATTLRLEHLAYHDRLTDLPNRALLLENMTHAIASANRHKTYCAILFIDLDRFKFVNDSLGHAAGDQLLCLVAARLREGVRDTDTLARQGGDEFVLLLDDIVLREDIDHIAAKLHLCMQPPFLVEEQHLPVSVSIGISVYPQDGDDGVTLLRRADSALYKAKERGRNCTVFASTDTSLGRNFSLTNFVLSTIES